MYTYAYICTYLWYMYIKLDVHFFVPILKQGNDIQKENKPLVGIQMWTEATIVR